MVLYAFEAIGEDLDLMPLPARRAADAAGIKPSLADWRSWSLELRRALVELGSEPSVNVELVQGRVRLAGAVVSTCAPRPDPAPETVPDALGVALGPERPLSAAVWSALRPLDRYALMKTLPSPSPGRLAAAYDEIVGESAHSTHLDAAGAARMVSVSAKQASFRRAVATSRVSMSSAAFSRLERADAPKGDVLGTARLAGIMAAKRTSELVPLCHPLSLTRVDVILSLDRARCALDLRAEVEAFDRTGVEMEALTAASIAALTVYDMLKAFDRTMQIGPTALAEKSGGKSGDYRRASDSAASTERFAVWERPLSVEQVLRAVDRPEAGGSVVFVGTVRNHNAGQPVTLLEYQAYPSMAVKEMERIALELETASTGVRLAALHRSGALGVGELAVVCAASAPHRDEAFSAARLFIDRIKESVPIWKREHGPDGPYWVGWHDVRH